MKLLHTIHRPDGMAGVVADKIACVWEYKLPSGKTGRCGATATWELVYQTGMAQPWSNGFVPLHTYRCDYHHTEDQ